jgi:hypothetical protein
LSVRADERQLTICTSEGDPFSQGRPFWQEQRVLADAPGIGDLDERTRAVNARFHESECPVNDLKEGEPLAVGRPCRGEQERIARNDADGRFAAG